MKNFVQPGENITVAAPYARNSGEGALTGALFGIASNNAANGAQVVLVTAGVFDIAKDANAIGMGAKVYWDNTAKKVTATLTSNTLIGVATAAALSGDSTCRVRLGIVA